jgi:hypothetical protein
MKLAVDWTLPIKLESEFNVCEHWTKKHKRHKMQKKWINEMWVLLKPHVELPCTVKLVRLSPRKFDFDNLVGAFKWIRDAVSDKLIPGKKPGMADSDERITWEYAQEKDSSHKVRIIINH